MLYTEENTFYYNYYTQHSHFEELLLPYYRDKFGVHRTPSMLLVMENILLHKYYAPLGLGRCIMP